MSTTEPLTASMIHSLRREAGAAGDRALVHYCDETSDDDEEIRDQARRVCAQAITDARSMDDSKPFVRVVP